MPVTYDPKDVAIVLDSHIVSGYAADTFIEIKPLGDGKRPQAGTDGEVTRLTSSDRTHEIALTLMQTSDTHQILNDYMHADQRDGSGIFSITISDPTVNASHYGYHAWVKGPPAYKYGKEAGEYTWTIYSDTLETTIDGKGFGGFLGAVLKLAGDIGHALGVF